MLDALSFLKLLWRPTPTPIPAANDTPSSFADTDDDNDNDDADSFFELDVALSDVDAKSCDSPKVPIHVDEDCIVLKSHKCISTPVSPISILRSSPSFRGPMFGRSRAAAGEETGDVNRAAKKSARLFTARLDDGPQRRNNAGPKDGFMKYMKKSFKVSYVGGTSRRYGYGGNEDKGSAASRLSPWSSPGLPLKKGRPESGIRVMGKSKSAVSSSSGADVNGRGRRNDVMAEQQEGIYGAILHCKKSYYPPSQ
ncbi:hypothetical protein MLD38_009022 [Melastoma candidum]|uniref:Uncharacterized protein n=1 Tax=Melastoma candidum TaxID=119954 RepID=A0ACB9RXI2_9MYRT|nr:hypothetical protein MLD38_009022 [Melastoma candidum]